MNNELYDRRKLFFSAQNRVALLLFFILILQVAVSTVYVAAVALFPFLKTNNTADSVLNMIMYVFYIGGPIIIWKLIFRRKLTSYVSFRKKLPKDAFAVFFLCLGVMYLAQVIALLMSDFFLKYFNIDLSAGSEITSSEPSYMIVMFISTAILPAVLEEIIARGIILGELLPYNRGVAIIFSGMLFGLMHMNPIQLPFACISGIIMAYFAVESGSLRIAIAVHFVNNALSVLFSFLPFYAGEAAVFAINEITCCMLLALGVASAVYLFMRKPSIKDSQSGTPLCAATDESLKYDMSGGLFANISPVMLAYFIAAVAVSLLNLIMLGTVS